MEEQKKTTAVSAEGDARPPVTRLAVLGAVKHELAPGAPEALAPDRAAAGARARIFPSLFIRRPLGGGSLGGGHEGCHSRIRHIWGG